MASGPKTLGSPMTVKSPVPSREAGAPTKGGSSGASKTGGGAKGR